MPTAYIYGRISKDEARIACLECQHEWEHTRGLTARCPKCGSLQEVKLPESIEAQKVRGIAYAQSKWSESDRPAIVFVPAIETASSDFAKRPEGGKIVASLAAGDHLIVTKLDRGWRNGRDFINMQHDFVKRTVTLHLIQEGLDTSTPMGKCIAGILALVSEMEWHAISERRKGMARHLKASGRAYCTAAFGKRIVIDDQGYKRLVDDPGEQHFLWWIYQLRKKRVPWELIHKRARDYGVVSRRGKPYIEVELRRLYGVARRLAQEGLLKPFADDLHKPLRLAD